MPIDPQSGVAIVWSKVFKAKIVCQIEFSKPENNNLTFGENYLKKAAQIFGLVVKNE